MNRLLALLLCLLVAAPALALERNVAGQYIEFHAIDTTSGNPKTGDAGNLTAYVSIDGDTTPNALINNTEVEVESTNAPGVYRFTLDATETNGKSCVFTCRSATANVLLYPRFVYPEPANFSLLSINSSGYVVLQDDSITAAKVAASAIGASEIGTGAIDADAIDTDAITSTEIADNAIDAGAIAADAIGAGEIAASAIGSAELADGAIDALSIATGAVDADAIAADAIGASELADASIDALSIATGAIDADATAAGAIDASAIAADAATEIANAGSVLYTGAIATVNSQTDFVLGASLGPTGSNLVAGQVVAFYDTSAGAVIPSVRTITHFDVDTGQLLITSAPDFVVSATDVVRIYPAHNSITTITAKLPSKAYLTGSTNSDGDVQLDEATGALPANSITATSIATDAITAAEVAASAIGADELANGAIAADAFAAGAIDASAIAADAIGASEIAADAIGASEVAADAIGASEIANNAITGAELDASAAQEVGNWGNQSIAAGDIANVVDTSNFELSLNAPILGESTGIVSGDTLMITHSGAVVYRKITNWQNGSGTVTVTPAYTSATIGDTVRVIRTNLDTTEQTNVTNIAAKLPSKAYLTGTANSDGDIQLNEATGALATDTITAASIAADAIGASEIATDAIGAAELAANSITSSEIATDAIGALEIADDAIDAGAIATDAIGPTEIAAGAISSSEIAANAIGASQIATGAITNAKFAAGAIDAASIATDAITNTKIAADAIGASEVATDAIGSAEIAASAIGASELATGALTSDEVTASYLQTFFTVDSGSTSTSAINGSVVKESTDGLTDIFNAADIELDPTVIDAIADAVWDETTTSHITSGTFGEQVKTDIDAILDDTGTSGVALATGAITSSKFGAGAIDAAAIAADAIGASEIAADTIGASEIATDAIGSSEVASATGTEVAGAVWDLATSGHVTSGTFGEQVKTDGDTVETRVATVYTDWINGGRLDLLLDAVATQSSLTTVGSNVTTVMGVTTKLDTAVELDGAVYRFTTNALEQGAAGGLTTASIADAVWDEAQSGHVSAGTFGVYVDASIAASGGGGASAIADAVWDEATAGHVGAGSFGAGVKLVDDGITAAKIAASAITSSEIATDAIDADAIAANAITSSEVADNTITAAKIAADAITSSEVADNTIDAGAIATDAITAAKIAADAITSSEVADNTIDAGAIATDAITAAKVAADAIGAAEIAADAIGSAELAADVVGASYNSSTDSLEALRDRMEVSPAVGTAGGGTLSARVSDSTLSPRKRFEIIQGEQKTVTFVTEAAGRFASATPTAITIKIKDAAGTVITKSNASVTRVTEEADLQVDRITLTPSDTDSLTTGYVTIELDFDGEKAILKTSLFIVSGL